MRKNSLRAALAVALSFGLLSGSASATVNHGDFTATDVEFLQVSETTQTADPEPLWGVPTVDTIVTDPPELLEADVLRFFPAAFTSSCGPGGSDTTESLLEMTISALAGETIERVSFSEGGDYTLFKAGFGGTPATNASTSVTGTITVIEDLSGPIAPVVIPFTGTFLPMGTFALPANLGTGIWNGGFDVDVLAAHANATKVELSLTNTLAANCEVGPATASIQKKNATPLVISVDAPPCSVDVEKKCCVPQPTLPDLDICEGEVVSMTLEFTGDSCKASNNDQGRAFKCYGRRRVSEPADVWVSDYSGTTVATPDTGINYGDTVVFTNTSGTLNDKTKFEVTGNHLRKQFLKIDTSCDRALACDDQFGAFKLAGLESTLGGVVDCSAPPPLAECRPPGYPPGTACDAKLVDLVLEYVGQDCQDPLGNPQNGEASCAGDATGAVDVNIIYTGQHADKQMVSPSSGINDGDRIRVTSTANGGLFPNQKYLITDGGGSRQQVEFHVSCSQPLALGDEFGSFEVVGFTTKTGFQAEINDGTDGWEDVCEVPLAPPGPHCTSDLQNLTLVYIGDLLGEGCTVSNPQKGLAECNGVADPGDPVTVTADPGLDVSAPDPINFGSLIEISATGGGDLPSSVTLWTDGAGGQQDIRIMSNCYKSLSLGDRFGSWVVFGMDREDEGPITLGGNVLYQYTVTNPSDTLTIENVSVDDDQLGNVGSVASLDPLASQEFVAGATLFGTTTNVATASADIGGAACEEGTDTATVNVLAPPPGSFSCNGPIRGMKMIWKGAKKVDVKAWAGTPHVRSLISEFVDVEPGHAVHVDGVVQAEFPVWQIFDSETGAHMGNSSFDHVCKDWSMNGIEDCGKNVGNLRHDDPSLINDWQLEGLDDVDESLECSPVLVPQAPACGLGPELLLVMPGLMWLHRRRLGRKD